MTVEAKLRGRLRLLYGCAVALVLTLMLLTVLWTGYREIRAAERAQVSTLLTAVSEQLQTASHIDISALKKTEADYGARILVRDNGRALTEDGADFAALEDLAARSGSDVSAIPLYAQRKSSDVFEITGERGAALGAVSILPVAGGYRSVSVLRFLDRESLLARALPALCFYMLGLLLLWIVGARLIDRALAPALARREEQRRFVAAASHELRAPLSVIAANAETLEAGAARETIGRECARMSRLIGDMLALAATDARDFAMVSEDVEIDTLCLDAYEAHARRFAKQGRELRLQLPDAPLPRVKGDRDRLAQALDILLCNALDHGATDEQPVVTLAAKTERHGARIEVTDHGVGLPDADKARVFERFYRGDASRRDKRHFGLGLSVAQGVVTRCGGKIGVADTPGGGCTFWMTFP